KKGSYVGQSYCAILVCFHALPHQLTTNYGGGNWGVTIAEKGKSKILIIFCATPSSLHSLSSSHSYYFFVSITDSSSLAIGTLVLTGESCHELFLFTFYYL